LTPFQAAIEVTRHTEGFNTARQEEPAYNLCTATAQALGQVIRDAGGIENRLHHVLDTVLEEDACHIRRNPGLLALIRHFALNPLRHNRKDNTKAALYDNALSLDWLLAYKGI
jgi:predicted transposase YbfD/YdcC